VRPSLRDVAFLLLYWTGVPFLLREVVQRRRTTILLYHDLQPEAANYHFGLLKKRYNIISLRHYVDAYQQGRLDELPPKSLVITLDDGVRGNRDLLPMLEKHQVPVTIFLCSEIVGTNRQFWWNASNDRPDLEKLMTLSDEERLEVLARRGFSPTGEMPEREALSRAEIEAMRPWVDFQAHTQFHPVLPRCSAQKVWEEIELSRLRLQQEYGLDIYAMAYPFGLYTDREALLVQDIGYSCALTIEPGSNGPHSDMFRLKRIGLRDTGGVAELLVKASGLWGLVRGPDRMRSY